MSILLQKLQISRQRDKFSAFSLVIFAVCGSDILLAAQMSLLWMADSVYSNNYVLKEGAWRSGVMCAVAFAILLWFSLSYPCLHLLMSVCRLRIVKYPFRTKLKETKFVLKCLCAIFILALILSLCSTFATRAENTDRQLPVSMCSPFFDPLDRFMSTKVITWFVICLQLTVIITIMYLDAKLYTKLKFSQKQLHGSVSKVQSNFSVLNHLTTISASNILCWVPSHFIYLVTMFLHQYPMELMVWTSVALTPLHSLTNKLVFLVTIIRKNHRTKERRSTASQQRRATPSPTDLSMTPLTSSRHY